MFRYLLSKESCNENTGTSFIMKLMIWGTSLTTKSRVDYLVHVFYADGNEEPSFNDKIDTLDGN